MSTKTFMAMGLTSLALVFGSEMSHQDSAPTQELALDVASDLTCDVATLAEGRCERKKYQNAKSMSMVQFGHVEGQYVSHTKIKGGREDPPQSTPALDGWEADYLCDDDVPSTRCPKKGEQVTVSAVESTGTTIPLVPATATKETAATTTTMAPNKKGEADGEAEESEDTTTKDTAATTTKMASKKTGEAEGGEDGEDGEAEESEERTTKEAAETTSKMASTKQGEEEGAEDQADDEADQSENTTTKAEAKTTTKATALSSTTPTDETTVTTTTTTSEATTTTSAETTTTSKASSAHMSKMCATRYDPRVKNSTLYTASPEGSFCWFGVDDRDEGEHCIYDGAKYGTLGWCYTAKDKKSWGSCSENCPLWGQQRVLESKIKKLEAQLETASPTQSPTPRPTPSPTAEDTTTTRPRPHTTTREHRTTTPAPDDDDAEDEEATTKPHRGHSTTTAAPSDENGGTTTKVVRGVKTTKPHKGHSTTTAAPSEEKGMSTTKAGGGGEQLLEEGNLDHHAPEGDDISEEQRLP